MCVVTCLCYKLPYLLSTQCTSRGASPEVAVLYRNRILLFTYKFLGHNLEWVDSFLYLGISISKNLSWSSQCEHVAARANRVLGMLKHNTKGAPQGSKLQAYYFDACSPPSWMLHPSLVSLLRKGQRKSAASCCLLDKQRYLFLLSLQIFKILFRL